MKKSIEAQKAELQSKLAKLEAKEAAEFSASRQKAMQRFCKLAQAEAKFAGVDFANVDAAKLKAGLASLMVFVKSDSTSGAPDVDKSAKVKLPKANGGIAQSA